MLWDVSNDWEDDATAPWYDTDHEEVEEGVCSSPEGAGDMCVEQLLMLKYRCTLSAKSLRVLASLAADAGAGGPTKDLGCRRAGWHCRKRIDDFTLFKKETERNYDVQVPGNDRLENDHVVTEIPSAPPHESIEEELAAADTTATKCREQECPQGVFAASSGTLECKRHCLAAGHLWTGLRSQRWTIYWGSSW